MVWRAWGTAVAYLFGALALTGLATLAGIMYAARTGNPEPYEFGDISDSSGDVLGHIGSYLAAAIIDPTASGSEAGVAVVVFGLIFLVHVSVGLVHVNPVLYLLRYRVYSGATTGGRTYYLVVRSEVADWKGQRLLVGLHDSILIETTQHGAP